MISEMTLTKGAVYFAGILICLGLSMGRDLLIKIGVAPLVLLAIIWFWQYTQKMKEARHGHQNQC